MNEPSPILKRAVVIEDELPIRRFLRAALEPEGFETVDCETAERGLREVAARPPDVVILDLGLPDGDGMEVLARIREWTQVPVIVLSARGMERDKVAALDAGADDYLTKPFGVGELLARLRGILRRVNATGAAEEAIFEVGELRIDFAKRMVFVGGAQVHLTPIEYRLLHLLARNAGKVLTHRQLLKEVWGPHATQETQYLRVYMGHLRHKIEREPVRPALLRTEPGVGYRLALE